MSLAPAPKQRPASSRAGPFSVRTVSRCPTRPMRGRGALGSPALGRTPTTSATIESPMRTMRVNAGLARRRSSTAAASACSSPIGEAMLQSQRSVSSRLGVVGARAGRVMETCRPRGQTGTPKSRSAALRLTLRSVDALRWPMMSAHGMWYSPAGNVFARMPGMTTLRGGT